MTVRSSRVRMAACPSLVLAWVVGLALVLLTLGARPASAREYEVDGVSIDATVMADGSISVVEQRTYVFKGSFNGIYWSVPRGIFEGREVESSIGSLGVMEEGSLREFVPAEDGAAGTYELSEQDDCWSLKLYWPAEDETVVFQVSYVMSGLATRWSDTAELYWQYVPVDEESDVEWTNVTATVHLPVPSGEPVKAGENVRAWAHGPLDGTVSIDGADVVLFSPGVGSREFLEARIAFPPSWLSKVRATDEVRLETILAEEDQWAKEANAARRRARLVAYGFPGLMSAIGIGSVVAAIVGKKRRRAKAPKPQFDDKYLRDVPTNDHPAVLGMLYHDGRPGATEFIATLMRLTDVGRIKLDAVWREEHDKHGRASRKRAWRMLPGRQTAAGFGKGCELREGGKKIDDTAYRFVFNIVGNPKRHDTDRSLCGPSGEPYVLDSFFAESAEKMPKEYAAAYGNWEMAVRDAFYHRKFQVDKEYSVFPGALGLADFAFAVALGIVGMFLQVPNLYLATGVILCFAGGIYCVMADDEEPIPVLSQEGAEVRAQLEALRRWLCDFTRLEEAIPDDVVLWNRLLVIATVLDVADEVVKQLRAFAPHVLDDERCTVSDWLVEDPEDVIGVPARSLAASVAKSSSSGYHSVSTSSLAGSRNSSSSGSGGGFSSGGGGGFSGGGRGGAF